MPKKQNPATFYQKTPAQDTKIATALQKAMETGEVDNHKVMTTYFADHWNDFKAFWKLSGETIDWPTFALAPHNAVFFSLWVFRNHPEIMELVEKDLIDADWDFENNCYKE